MRRTSLLPLIAALATACGNTGGGTASASPHAATTPDPAPAPAPAQASSAPLVGATRAPPEGPAARRYVVAAIGDSLTDPKSHGGIYLEVLKRRCPKSDFVSYGVGGNMANMMRKRFLRDVFGEDPPGTKSAERPRWTHVIVLGGLGDVISNLTAKRTAPAIQREIAWMVAEAHARGAEALVLTLPPWAGAEQYDAVRGQMARDVNAWIAAESGRSIDATFDTRPVLSCGQPEKLCAGLAAPDGLHWSRAGQEKLGEALAAGPFADCE